MQDASPATKAFIRSFVAYASGGLSSLISRLGFLPSARSSEIMPLKLRMYQGAVDFCRNSSQGDSAGLRYQQFPVPPASLRGRVPSKCSKKFAESE